MDAGGREHSAFRPCLRPHRPPNRLALVVPNRTVAPAECPTERFSRRRCPSTPTRAGVLEQRLVLDVGLVLDRAPAAPFLLAMYARYSGAPGNLTLSATTIAPGAASRARRCAGGRGGRRPCRGRGTRSRGSPRRSRAPPRARRCVSPPSPSVPTTTRQRSATPAWSQMRRAISAFAALNSIETTRAPSGIDARHPQRAVAAVGAQLEDQLRAPRAAARRRAISPFSSPTLIRKLSLVAELVDDPDDVVEVARRAR